MLPPLFRIDTILDACENKELILTANQRLKSKAIQAWGIHQQKSEKTVWRAPRIMTLEQWLGACWQNLQSQAYPESNQTLASSEQERVIWETITANCGLMQTERIAQQAASGLRLLERWQLPLSSLNSDEFDKQKLSNDNASEPSASNQGHLNQGYLDQDHGNRLYRQWCEEFISELQQKRLITLESSCHIISQALSNGTLEKESTIHLLGFDDVPPLFQGLLTLASKELKEVDLNSAKPSTRVRTTCPDSDTEMTVVAEWAKSIIEKEPEARIGIIVPNLGQCRNKIERALIHSFESHSLSADTPRYTYPFNISAGTPLGDTPLIDTTFQLLKLSQQTWQVEGLCQILFSPFWGKLEAERESRYQLANKLESLGVFEVDLSQVRYWSEAISKADDNDLIEKNNKHEGIEAKQKSLLFHYFYESKQLIDTIHREGKKHLPSTWVDYFLEHLAILNWPGSREPDSHEYQQTQLWYQVLEDFCALDNTLGRITLSDAIQQCQRMSNHRPFQAQVPDSPIQVLGILEGAGLHFTHCWVLGLHQQAWPPAPQPNPLLPLPLQRQHNMPHASSLRELTFAQSLTENYRYCAEHIIFSSPEYDEDSEQILLTSRLIDDIPLQDLGSLKIDSTNDFLRYSSELHQSQQWEFLDCLKGPAVSEQDLNERGELSGGANIIKAQSTNPFDAFAIYRLNARPVLKTVNGFSSIEKGNILHQSLAIIWEKLKNQKALLEIDEPSLTLLVKESVDLQIQMLQRKKPKHLGHNLCQLESERQTKLILLWLNEVEKQRPAFEVVGIEEAYQVTLKDMSFTLRLDRVDKLSDGTYLIIDYKTGATSVNDWQSERPREPQLPLYLITRQESVNGIAFAEINVNKQRFNGACASNEESIAIAGIKPIGDLRSELPESWPEAKTYWENTLSSLLDEFLQGQAQVDYRDNSALHYNKELQYLNRLYDKNRF